jgi:PPOX class probable F420-dependent enzyme
MNEQRRGGRISMTVAQREAFLSAERTCRVATVGVDGTPHVTPLWFAWDGTALWLTSVVRSQRWADIQRTPNVSVVIDAGVTFDELRGIEIMGTASPIGEVPRMGSEVHELEEPERIYSSKYMGITPMSHDGRHAWLRITPTKIVSWDFRTMKN